MEDQTCMEYLFRSVQNNHIKDINQNILFNASNEFRNLWNLVKKLRDLARVDVQKITRFLDAIQVGLEKKDWTGASKQSIQAEHEYKQIRRYIRPSFVEDFKVARFIENVDPAVKSKSGTKREKKPPSSLTNHRRPNFRNRQINNDNATEKKESSETENEGTGKKDTKQQNKDASIDKNAKLDDKVNKNLTIVQTKGNNQAKTDKSRWKNQTETEVENHIGVEERKADTSNHCAEEGRENNKSEVQTVENVKIKNDDVSTTKNIELQESVNNDKQPESQLEIGKSEDNKAEERAEEMHGKNNATAEKESKFLSNEQEGLETIDRTKNDDNKVTLNVDNEQRNGQKQEHFDNPNTTDNKNNHHRDASDSQPLDISYLVSKRVTDVSPECNADDIVLELGNIYELDWGKAYRALTQCQPSNGMKNTIDFLGEILQVAEETVKKVPEKNSTGLKKEEVGNGTKISLENLKKEFLQRHLKNLQSEHRIEYTNDTGEYSVNLYAAKCVELAWFMHTRKPQMVFDYNSRPMLLEDLFEFFKPYKNKGNCIHYVVWPAIRRCQGGKVVAKGIAEFR